MFDFLTQLNRLFVPMNICLALNVLFVLHWLFSVFEPLSIINEAKSCWNNEKLCCLSFFAENSQNDFVNLILEDFENR